MFKHVAIRGGMHVETTDMIDIQDICSLTDFQRNAKKYARQMSKTGRPLVLTVNGKPGLVVQDAHAYGAAMREYAEPLQPFSNPSGSLTRAKEFRSRNPKR